MNETRMSRTELAKWLLIGLLQGILVVVLVWSWNEAVYEDGLMDQVLKVGVISYENSQDKAVEILGIAHSIVESRHEIFVGMPYIGLRDTVFRSAGSDLMDGRGGCGSYAAVLGRLLQRAGFEVRIARMRCGQREGCHMVVEVKMSEGWAVLDPMYNVYFPRQDGSLAGFEEVGKDWDYYKRFVPNGYPVTWFKYDGVDYTNWKKIPILGEIVGSIFGYMGMDKVSVRAYILNKYWFIFYASVILNFVFVLFGLRVYFFKSRSIPLSHSRVSH